MTPFFGLTARVALIWIFGAAVLSKLSSRSGWAAFVEALPALGLPERIPGRIAAVAVVAGEAVALVTLVVVPRLGAAISAGLLLGFTVALAAAVRAGSRTACHCFGSEGAAVGRHHVLRNALLLGVSATAWVAAGERFDLTAAHVAAVGHGALIGFLMTRWDDLMFLLGVRLELAEPVEPPSGGT